MTSPNAESMQDRYPLLYRDYRWHVPDDFNLAQVCCQRWAAQEQRTAILVEDPSGHSHRLSYRDLQRQANRLSNLMQDLGVQRGACVAIILPQSFETAIAHIACYQLGAVAMPLSTLFGPDALAYRLSDSQAVLAIVDQSALPALTQVRPACPSLRQVLALGEGAPDALDWGTQLAACGDSFTPCATRASDPAILIYTSGTTGAPKGALLPQSVLIGNLPGFVASQDWFPREGDVFWSPADWAWTGGLMDALLPTLYFGKPIVAHRGRFSAQTAFHLLEKYAVTNTFLFPTALKIMMKSVPRPRERYQLRLRAIMSAGEAVGDAVFDWAAAALGITINEMFGQTEINYIVGNSSRHWPAKPGSMGRPYPGHQVAVLDEHGQPAPPGRIGDIAVKRHDIHGHPDPVLFIGYWNNPQATRDKFSGDWCRTGDLAYADEDGYLWYQGRSDDMFKSAGYRIGPVEIENCLIKHPAVVNAAVVPKPDAERGNIVKAFVVLAPGYQAQQDGLVAALQEHVRGMLAPYEYPKEIEFLDELPMTTTGKIQRRVLRQLEQERAGR